MLTSPGFFFNEANLYKSISTNPSEECLSLQDSVNFESKATSDWLNRKPISSCVTLNPFPNDKFLTLPN